MMRPHRAVRGRAPVLLLWSASNSEHTCDALTAQANRLRRRFRMSPALATIVAELAYGHGRSI